MPAVYRPLPLLLALACMAAPAHAEPLRPSAGQRVVANAAVVANELQQVMAADSSRKGEELKALVDTGTNWRIYYRDRQLLFAIPVRKNLLGSEKASGEREAAELARATLQQKFSQMLALDDASAGLDRDAVRVVFIEPDIDQPYTRGVGSGRVGQGLAGVPLPIAPAGAWSGWAAPASGCGCH
jgi:hypothetical protein